MDYQKFKGIKPYASELLGLYQTLLGWKSQSAIRRVKLERGLIADRVAGALRQDILSPVPITQIDSANDFDKFLASRIPDYLDHGLGQKLQKAIIKYINEKKVEPTTKELKDIFNQLKHEESDGKGDHEKIVVTQSIKEMDLAIIKKGDLSADKLSEIGAHKIKNSSLYAIPRSKLQPNPS